VLPAAALQIGKNQVQISFEASNQSLNRSADYLYTSGGAGSSFHGFPLF